MQDAATADPRAEPGDGSAQPVLDLHVAELRQLFNSMDPAPFRRRDLDAKAQAYIVEWAQELRTDTPLQLRVHVDDPAVRPGEAVMLGEAIDEYFRQRALATRRALAKLFRIGRVSLLIGVLFVAAAAIIGEAIAGLFSKERYATLVHDSLVIGAWVALWRPMEIFLYDWWPIRAEARLYERLSRLDVRLVRAGGSNAEGEVMP